MTAGFPVPTPGSTDDSSIPSPSSSLSVGTNALWFESYGLNNVQSVGATQNYYGDIADIPGGEWYDVLTWDTIPGDPGDEGFADWIGPRDPTVDDFLGPNAYNFALTRTGVYTIEASFSGPGVPADHEFMAQLLTRRGAVATTTLSPQKYGGVYGDTSSYTVVNATVRVNDSGDIALYTRLMNRNGVTPAANWTVTGMTLFIIPLMLD